MSALPLKADMCGATTVFGYKQTYAVQKGMSALTPIEDMCSALAYVCFGPIADMGRSFRWVLWTIFTFLFPAAAKESTDSGTRPYPGRHTRQYGQPQFPTVKLWAEPQYEGENDQK
jgi:hypothetical protein